MRPRVLAVAILFSPALIGWAIPLPGRRDAAARFASARSAAASLSGGSMAAAPRPGPAGAFDKAVNLGAEKAAKPWKKIVPLALAAGIHVALGAWIAVSIGGSIPNLKAEHPGLQRLVYGAFGLPVGLLLTLIAGGELVTGNFAVCTAAVLEGRASLGGLLRNWAFTYGGNLVSCVLMAFMASTCATGVGEGAIATAVHKVSAPFAATFCRGLLCNWLVCMAVWMATSADDIASKAAAVWFPVCGFAATGLDHSVANMFLIPFGMLQGADISVGDFVFKNLIPATLGNIVGGALCVAGVYKAAYGKPAVAAVHAPGAPVAVEQNEGGPGPFWWMSGSAPQVQQKPAGVELEHDAQRSKWSKGIPALA